MAKPPPSGPHSDIAGVNQDARAGKPSKDARPDPGAALDNADKGSSGRPDESDPEVDTKAR